MYLPKMYSFRVLLPEVTLGTQGGKEVEASSVEICCSNTIRVFCNVFCAAGLLFSFLLLLSLKRG